MDLKNRATARRKRRRERRSCPQENDATGANSNRTTTQDDHHPQQQVDMTEKVNETSPLIDQSLLPDVENNYVNSMGENSDDLEFLDSNRLDSATGFLGNGISDVHYLPSASSVDNEPFCRRNLKSSAR